MTSRLRQNQKSSLKTIVGNINFIFWQVFILNVVRLYNNTVVAAANRMNTLGDRSGSMHNPNNAAADFVFHTQHN